MCRDQAAQLGPAPADKMAERGDLTATLQVRRKQASGDQFPECKMYRRYKPKYVNKKKSTGKVDEVVALINAMYLLQQYLLNDDSFVAQTA